MREKIPRSLAAQKHRRKPLESQPTEQAHAVLPQLERRKQRDLGAVNVEQEPKDPVLHAAHGGWVDGLEGVVVQG